MLISAVPWKIRLFCFQQLTLERERRWVFQAFKLWFIFWCRQRCVILRVWLSWNVLWWEQTALSERLNIYRWLSILELLQSGTKPSILYRHIGCFNACQLEALKPGSYSSRRLSPTVARLGDSRRQSRVCLYFSWRLSPAHVGDCRQQSPTVVFKVQQCWTFNSVASSRWYFPSNQWTATAFNKVTTHADLKKHLLLNI